MGCTNDTITNSQIESNGTEESKPQAHTPTLRELHGEWLYTNTSSGTDLKLKFKFSDSLNLIVSTIYDDTVSSTMTYKCVLKDDTLSYNWYSVLYYSYLTSLKGNHLTLSNMKDSVIYNLYKL